MKYETYSEYDPTHSALAESAFLTVWAGLGQWHESLVLIGGMVPKYLCGQTEGPNALPRPVTLDVDLGIALATDGGQYGSLLWDLSAQGFKPNEETPSRFEKVINGVTVPIDFLVERPPRTTGTAQVADITAGILPGVERALKNARSVEVTGTDLHGATQNLTARVCEVGPFLAFKLRAFFNRQQPKDAFDILYTILHYDGGIDSAIGAFADEISANNPACKEALLCLREHFATEISPGPVKASHFVLGAPTPGESEEIAFLRASIRQDVVSAATRLLEAAEHCE